MRKILIVLLSFMISISALHSSSLLNFKIEEATYEQLTMMCSVRGLSTEGTKEELIQRLKSTFEIENPENEKKVEQLESDNKIENSSYILEIKKSDSLKKIGEKNPLIILEGDSQISFKKSEEEEPQILKASQIILDLSSSTLSALSNVSYESTKDVKNESVQNIEGNIVTLNLNTDDLNVSGGTIQSERKNSDGKKVTFTASSSLLTYDNKNNSVMLQDGYITTNPKTSYSSIKADQLALLPNGDMFLKNATISIGRVPVLYLPYFFSPGARMVGNPAIGYELNRGFFVNTTFEIFGTYPNFKESEKSSFSSLLVGDSDKKSQLPTSSIYQSSDSLTPLQKWAKDSSSYLALIYDVYEKNPYLGESGIAPSSDTNSFVFGYYSSLNFLNNKLKINSYNLFSFASEGEKGDITDYRQFPVFRYDGNLDVALNLSNTSLKIKLPYKSDPKVTKTYSNRLSNFSLDALWNRNQKFPTTYSSDINSYLWEIEGSYKMAKPILNNFINNFQISSFKININNKWEKVNSSYKYSFQEYTLPKIVANVSGTIFDFNDKDEEEETTTEPVNLDNDPFFKDEAPIYAPSRMREFTFSNLAKQYLEKQSKKLAPIDKLKVEAQSKSKAVNQVKLDYSIKEDYYYEKSDLSSTTATSDIYNKTDFDLYLTSTLGENLLDFSSTLNTSLYYRNETNLNKNTIISNKNKIKFPFMNLTYYLDTILYKETYSKTSVVTENKQYFSFTDDSITRHAIEWSKKYEGDNFYIQPVLNYSLPPLKSKLTSSLTFDNDLIRDKVSSYFNFESGFEIEKISNEFRLNLDHLTFNFNTIYDFSKINTPLIRAFTFYGNVNYKIDNLSLDQSYKYEGISKQGIVNNFEYLKTKLDTTYLLSEFNLSTLNNEISPDYWLNTFKLVDYKQFWWKNRMGVSFSLNSSFNFSFREKYSTYFSFKTSLSFAIAEFMTLDFSMTSANHGFYRYYDNNDKFSFNLMFEDLFRSFDIFGGGNKKTQFNLEDISLDFVHKMDDWDLHCKYTGTVVLSNYTYKWVPSFSIFLQWKTIPELKIDNSFTKTTVDSKEIWVKSN